LIANTPLAEFFWQHGRCDECPVIDMHGHMGPYSMIYFPRANAESMLHSMDQCGVRMLVFSHHTALNCPDIGNTLSIKAVREYPDRLRAYMVVHPSHPEMIEHDLATYDEYSDVYVGLKFFSSYWQIPWDAPVFESAWHFANERKLLVLGHTWGGSIYDGEAQVRKIASLYPNVRLILGHSLHGAWDEAVAIADEFPNLYLDLTSLTYVRGAVERFVAEGFSERILFGTDLPWFKPHQCIGALLSADITDDDRHNILHRNARQLLHGAGVDIH